MDALKRKRRGGFDRDEGVAKAQALFHHRGYDAVGVADLTRELGVNPPSLYAAYGSKAELFRRTLQRYASTSALPLARILKPGRPPAEALSALLVSAARQYGSDSQARGCLVTEATRADDDQARQFASDLSQTFTDVIRAYVESVHPKRARQITDFVVVTTRGLSSFACSGMSQARLIEAAKMAGQALSSEFRDETY